MLYYIHDYRRRLDDLRRIAGADNEDVLSPADAKDHLDREIEAKLRKGYPSDRVLLANERNRD